MARLGARRVRRAMAGAMVSALSAQAQPSALGWRSRAPRLLPLAAASLLKLTLSVGLLSTGFHAVSDDDFARVFIAQGFASSPSFDPSGTSWLPAPFWLNGGAMLVFGPSLTTARGVAILSGILAIGLVYLAGRWLRLSRVMAALGAALSGAFPYSVVLGAATVPEALTAAAVVLAAVSTSRREILARGFGVALLGAATLSRYEAWPVAAGFAALTLWDAARARGRARGAYLAASALSLMGCLLWVLHGALHHGSPSFFVDRVASYRRAIGAAPSSTWDSLLGYPLSLVRGEPELIGAATLTALCLGALCWRRRASADKAPAPPAPVSGEVTVSSAAPPEADEAATSSDTLPSGPGRRASPWLRPALLLTLMLLSLIYGDVRDGAPTHHPERAIFALWLFIALWLPQAVYAVLQRASKRGRALTLLGLGAVVLLGALLLRPWYARRDAFIDRRDAVRLGAAAKEAGAESLAVWSEDYGFFAVMVGFEAPEQASPLRPKPRDASLPPLTPETLEAALEARGVRFVALPAHHQNVLNDALVLRAEQGAWILAERL